MILNGNHVDLLCHCFIQRPIRDPGHADPCASALSLHQFCEPALDGIGLARGIMRFSLVNPE
jgi:hypothetical protein